MLAAHMVHIQGIYIRCRLLRVQGMKPPLEMTTLSGRKYKPRIV